MLTLTEDTRPITHLCTSDIRYQTTRPLGLDYIDEIIAYCENGEMAPVVWFALFMEGKLLKRINGRFVESVRYHE